LPRKSEGDRPRQYRPATTPEGRESQLISQAYDLVEKRIRNGTATSQEVTHFLKLGSTREKLEQERLRHENELTAVKIAAIASQESREEIYRDALNAMRGYQGREPLEIENTYDD
jgi:hypothetical protein